MASTQTTTKEEGIRNDGASIEVDGRRLFYLDSGAGQPLILLHGWGADHTAWEPVSDRLRSKYRVIAIDLRGHGRSEAADSYPFAALASDLFGLLNQLELSERPILVGHSMGGMVVQQFAVDYPEVAEAIIVIDADLNAQLIRPFMTLVGHISAMLMGWLASMIGENRALSLYPPMLDLSAYSGAWRKEHVRHRQVTAERFVRTNSTKGLASSFQAYASRPDLTTRLTHTAPRALLVRGTRDRIMTQSKMEALARAIPGSRLELVKGAGHMTIIERPDTVATLIDVFVGSAIP